MAVSTSQLGVFFLMGTALLLHSGRPAFAARKTLLGFRNQGQGESRYNLCRVGMFDDRPHGPDSGPPNCRPCSQCLPGYGVSRLCTRYNDTECYPCPGGQYSAAISQWDDCLPCRQCAEHQPTERACTTVANTVCSSDCSHGYFYSALGEQCLPCSPCHANPRCEETSVRVAECQKAGMDPGMQCWPLPASRRESAGARDDESSATSDGFQRDYIDHVGTTPAQHSGGEDAVDLDDSTARTYMIILLILIVVVGLCAVLSVALFVCFCRFLNRVSRQTTHPKTKNGYHSISTKTSKLLVRGSTYV